MKRVKRSLNYIASTTGANIAGAGIAPAFLILYPANQRMKHYWNSEKTNGCKQPFRELHDLPFCRQQPVARKSHIDMSKPATELVYGNARKGLLLSEKSAGWGLANICYEGYRAWNTCTLQQKFAAGKIPHYNSRSLTAQEHNDDESGEMIHVIIAADQR